MSFDVPKALQKVSFTLTVSVQKKQFHHTGQYLLNGIDKSSNISDIFLRRDTGGYHLDCLGKTGEPLV